MSSFEAKISRDPVIGNSTNRDQTGLAKLIWRVRFHGCWNVSGHLLWDPSHQSCSVRFQRREFRFLRAAVEAHLGTNSAMKMWTSVHFKVNPGTVHLECEPKVDQDEGLMESALSEVCVCVCMCVRLTATDPPSTPPPPTPPDRLLILFSLGLS